MRGSLPQRIPALPTARTNNKIISMEPSPPKIITPPPPQIIVPRPNQRIALVQNIPPATPDDPPPSERVYKLVAQWLSSTVGIEVTPSIVGMVLGSLPGINTAFSFFDVVRDVTVLVSYNEEQKKWGYENFTYWTETAIDIIGLVPVPPLKQASMGFKSAIRQLYDPKVVFEALKTACSGFAEGALIDMLTDLAKESLPAYEAQIVGKVDEVLDGMIKGVDHIAHQPVVHEMASLYAFFTNSTPPDKVIKDCLFNVKRANKNSIGDIMRGNGEFIGLIPLVEAMLATHKGGGGGSKGSGKGKNGKGANNHEGESRAINRNGTTGQENQHVRPQEHSIATHDRTQGQQRGTAGQKCNSCHTKHPINLATGEEVLHQTDFATPGLVPVMWTRCYRSTHYPYDSGTLGARWATPYTTGLTQSAHGLVYHDAEGRNVSLPLIPIGEQIADQFEAFILRRDSATQFSLIYRNGDCDLFRLEQGNGPGMLESATGLRYALREKRTKAGPTLYILPLDEARQQFRAHPVSALLDPDTLLVITDGAHLWLECRKATTDHFAANSPAAKAAVSDLAALHEANQQAGIALLTEDHAQLQPAAYLHQLVRLIGSVQQIMPNGSRHEHVHYRYAPGYDNQGMLLQPEEGLDLVAQTDAEHHERTYAYMGHLLTRYTDYNGFGQNLEWYYDPAWAPFPVRCIRTVADDGSEDTRLWYDAWFNETTLTDAAGNQTIFTYNQKNLITGIEIIVPGESHPFAQRVWDQNGNLLKKIDPEARLTCYTYDDQGNLLSMTDPAGAVTKYEYDAHNNLVKVIDPAGKALQRAYDSKGNLISQIDSAGHTTSYTYNDLGQLIAKKDAHGGTTTLAYNIVGQLVAMTDCSGKTTRYSYNPLGHLITSTDAVQQVTRYETDKLGRVTTAIAPDGSRTQYQYDAENRLLATSDAKGKTTRYSYNHQGLLTTRLDPNGHSLFYHYDKLDRLTRLVNQNGERYDFTYDMAGRLIEKTGFDSKATRYEYNHSGFLIASISGKTRTEYTRSETGQLLEKKVHQDTPAGPSLHTTSYQYDALDNLIWVKHPQGELFYQYNEAGHLIGEEQRIRFKYGKDIVERIFTLQHTVDELGNRLETTLPNGRKIGIQRYGSGHWIGTLWNGSPIADLERDDLHRETVRELGRQPQQRLRQTRSHDALSRLTGVKLVHARGQVLAGRHMQYDPVGNLTHIEDFHRDKISYQYDPVGQLLQATQSGLTETFAFDPAGNLIEGTSQGKGKLANTQGKDHATWQEGLDQLTEQPHPESVIRPWLAPVTRNLLKAYLGMEFDYDQQGNTVRKVIKGKEQEQPYSLNLHYDGENRLIKAVKPQGTQTVEAEYKYDAFGRRIAKIVRTRQEAKATGTWGGSSHMHTISEDMTFFVWDGDTLIQEVKPNTTITYLYEPDSFVPLAQVQSDVPDSIYAAQAVQARKQAEAAQAQEEQGEAEKLKWLEVTDRKAYEQAVKTIAERKVREEREAFIELERQGQEDWIYFVNTDHLGTPQEVVSEDGNIVWLARYKAWGRIHKLEREDIKQPFRFQGQYFDEETGLHYNRHRYYDPDVGRFVSQDPIGLAGGDNLYLYGPNPITWLDVLGLSGVYIFETLKGNAYIGKGQRDRYLESTRERTVADESFEKAGKDYDKAVTRGAHLNTKSPCDDISEDDYALMVEHTAMTLYPFVPGAKPTLNTIRSPGQKRLNTANAAGKCPKLQRSVNQDAATLIAKMQSKSPGSGR